MRITLALMILTLEQGVISLPVLTKLDMSNCGTAVNTKPSLQLSLINKLKDQLSRLPMTIIL
jgi:hypothetical protein